MNLLAVLAVTAIVLGAADEPRQILDPKGNRIGVIRSNPYGGVDVYDATGNRIGIGRESPADGSIRIYDPRTGKPLYDIRQPRQPGGGAR